jgi:rhodanese-related sulfurtransferase
MSGGYAGDISPQEAWKILEAEPDAVLIDVRTQAEWQFVGVPALRPLGKELVLAEWIQYPGGALNPSFVDQVKQALPSGGDPALLFLCRSGQRSQGAAAALTREGYSRCYNILEGFEGNHDSEGHRGTTGGWKVVGLPWAQG